jgi:hypothetical protein
MVPEWVNLDTPWPDYIPFAFTLVELLSPKIIVELGTQQGDFYLAFCQGVKTLNLSTHCFAYSTWEDVQSYKKLKNYNDANFRTFSKLTRGPFSIVPSNFKSTSIDILHICGLNDPKKVVQDFESFLPFMSDEGVVLFDNINNMMPLWRDLCTKYPNFELDYKKGLGLLVVRNKIPLGLASFIMRDRSSSAFSGVIFQSLDIRLLKLYQIRVLIEDHTQNLKDLEITRAKTLKFIKKINRNLSFIMEQTEIQLPESFENLRSEEKEIVEKLLNLEKLRRKIIGTIKLAKEKYSKIAGTTPFSDFQEDGDHIIRGST